MNRRILVNKKKFSGYSPLSNELVILRNGMVTRESYLTAVWKIKKDRWLGRNLHFNVARIMNAGIISHKPE